jgi:hypothetical protein
MKNPKLESINDSVFKALSLDQQAQIVGGIRTTTSTEITTGIHGGIRDIGTDTQPDL